MYLKPEKGTTFRQSLPVWAIIGSTPRECSIPPVPIPVSKVIRSISTSSWMGCYSITGLPPVPIYKPVDREKHCESN